VTGHAPKADKLLIKPTAGARPAPPCTPGRFIRKARTTRPDARRVTSNTADTSLATAPDGPTRRLSQKPESEFDANWVLEYPDAETLGRALVAVAGLAVLAGPEREQELKTAIVDGLAPYRTPNGSYRLSNEYHYLIATA
jgi:hypothetical protein